MKPRVKIKVQHLLQRFLHETDSRVKTKSALQSWKWQLIGMS